MSLGFTSLTRQANKLSQRKYALNLLQEIGLVDCKPASSPLEVRPKFRYTNSPMLEDVNCYQQLPRKMIYATTTSYDITCDVNILSHLMHKPSMVHWEGKL